MTAESNIPDNDCFEDLRLTDIQTRILIDKLQQAMLSIYCAHGGLVFSHTAVLFYLYMSRTHVASGIPQLLFRLGKKVLTVTVLLIFAFLNLALGSNQRNPSTFKST